VSHDLRAPLRHIAGYTELLGRDRRPQLSERGKRFLSISGSGALCRQPGRQPAQLLADGPLGLALSDVDLNALVEVIRTELAPDYEGRAIVWDIARCPR
jgi:light-regulated signal transduction histidine kinase (bacteriophytochrome)